MERSGDVGGGLEVLSATVEEKEFVGADGTVGFFGGSVVDDRAVGACGGDREEGVREIVWLRAAVGLDAVCDVELGEFA